MAAHSPSQPRHLQVHVVAVVAENRMPRKTEQGSEGGKLEGNGRRVLCENAVATAAPGFL